MQSCAVDGKLQYGSSYSELAQDYLMRIIQEAGRKTRECNRGSETGRRSVLHKEVIIYVSHAVIETHVRLALLSF